MHSYDIRRFIAVTTKSPPHMPFSAGSQCHKVFFKSILNIQLSLLYLCRPGSSVGIATCYGLDGPGTESRWGARFSAPIQTGPGVHPASCTVGTGSFLGIESGRGVTLTPHPLLVPRSKNSRAIPLPSLRAFMAYGKCETCLLCLLL
jgi:hypothetical protein